MTQQDDILARLIEILREVFDDDTLIARPDMTADDVEEWDSMSHIRLILSIEEAFGIKFSTTEIGRLENVGTIAETIAAKTGA